MYKLTRSWEIVHTGIGPRRMVVVRLDYIPIAEFPSVEEADWFIQEYKKRL